MNAGRRLGRMAERFRPRRGHPLPEAAPDADLWARVLWPWLTAVERCPRPALLLARAITGQLDARDLTVDVARVPIAATDFTRARALAVLVEAALLAPADNGRHRLVVPGS